MTHLIRWALKILILGPFMNTAFAQTTASQLFELFRPSVVEVLTKTRGNESVASAASGFITHRNDWVITNYHAVTKVLFEPDENDLMVVTHERKRISAQVIAVDVRNDLAILQLSKPMGVQLLKVRASLPSKGETGYSLGKPGFYKHSIVSGTFNGLVEEEITPLLMFNGPINGGMSGGPTLNAFGEVVGVNVASSTNNQLIGLLVPSVALKNLIDYTENNGAQNSSALLNSMAKQFAMYGRLQQDQLSKVQRQQRTLGPFIVQGDLSTEEECRSISKNDSNLSYKVLQQRCESPNGLYINKGIYAGQMYSGAFWINGKNLSAFALSRVVEQRIKDLRKVGDEDSHPRPWSCSEQRLLGNDGIPIQLYACRRQLEKLPGLFDYRFRYTPLISGKDALVVAVGLHGYDDETAKAAIQKSISSVRVRMLGGTQ